jgi:hypothetical protein
MNLYLDIETIPTQRQDVCDYLSETLRDDTLKAMESVCAPANYKDADKIAEYIASKKAALQAEFAEKLKEKIDSTGLDGSFGQVFCIGWAMDNEGPTTSYGMNEREVLDTFGRLLRVKASEQFLTTVIGHNVSASTCGSCRSGSSSTESARPCHLPRRTGQAVGVREGV